MPYAVKTLVDCRLLHGCTFHPLNENAAASLLVSAPPLRARVMMILTKLTRPP